MDYAEVYYLVFKYLEIFPDIFVIDFKFNYTVVRG